MNEMETVEILHYKWCLWTNSKNEAIIDDYILMEANAFPVPGIRGDILVYCKVERWRVCNNTEGIISKTDTAGIRIVPVKRSEMDTI